MINKPTASLSLVLPQSYAKLPDHFYANVAPVAVKSPQLIAVNHKLATELGLHINAENPDWLDFFSGNTLPDNATPLALVYAGHQFGHFNAQLGDGRAVLLGEITARNGKIHDIQLKGSGITPFSRNGDGRAALGPVMREYILAEAMHNLGIPTTRALAFVTSGEYVLRETALPGAILTRIAESHIRVGTFEYFAARQDKDALEKLTHYAISRHTPHLHKEANPPLEFFRLVVEKQARLIAKWMSVGFIHGVMNTDNMAISGETIDYGPCAFMDTYIPRKVFSSIDHHGRYAYDQQPRIAQWNLSMLASALLPVFSHNREHATGLVQEILQDFPDNYKGFWLKEMRQKLGLHLEFEEDVALIENWLDTLHNQGADFTNSFRNLGEMVEPDPKNSDILCTKWLMRWRQRLKKENASQEEIITRIKSANPNFIPRNHRVEEAIRAAVERNDFSVMNRLISLLSRPFDDQPENEIFRAPPEAHEEITRTFCGT